MDTPRSSYWKYECSGYKDGDMYSSLKAYATQYDLFEISTQPEFFLIGQQLGFPPLQ